MGYKRHKPVQEFSSNKNLALQGKLQDAVCGGLTWDRQQEQIKEKTIRIGKWSYDELREIGKMGMDLDGVITKLLKEYKERHKGK